MIIDAHQHFWDLSRGDYGWLTPRAGVLYRNYLPEDLVTTLRENEVRATILVQAAPTEAETHYLFRLAQVHSFVAGVVGWASFESPDAPERITTLALGDTKLRGLRPMIQDIEDRNWITKPSLDSAFEAMVAHDLVFDALVRPLHLNALWTRLLRHPKLRAVLDHAGKPDIARGSFDMWAVDLERLAHETDIYCKMSGVLTEAGDRSSSAELAPYVAHVFSCFGPKRVLWGSDWPVLNAVSDYGYWLRLSRDFVTRFAREHVNDVFGDTAKRVYKLELK